MFKFNWKLWAVIAVVVGLLAYLWVRRTGGVPQGFQNPSDPTFTMYYADWCGHCKNAKPDFEKLVAKGQVDVGGKKCNVRMVSPEKEPELAKGKPIKGFPTFLLEMPDGTVTEYKGERSTPGYLEFINKVLGGKTGAPATGTPAE